MPENGRFPRSDLSRIYHPTETVYLEKATAAAWNTLCLKVWKATGMRLYPNGPNSAYRSFEAQVLMKQLYGDNAAEPGTSNHGLGLAVDLATTDMRAVLDRLGEKFGWAKKWSNASWEWWHIKYRSGEWARRPNPGPSVRYPLMAKGSGGPGQRPYVDEIRRHLRRRDFKVLPTGDFTAGVEMATKKFQAEHNLGQTGVVNPPTWKALRRHG
jgi:Putative peptidoglycan binding domain